jgi:anti-sigma regulatory factor (Ser/Thr protein kinase)
VSTVEHVHPTDSAFRHEALFYASEDEFVAGTTAFIREGVAAAEPVLVIVGAAKVDLLREALNGDCEGVRIGNMAEVGLNPARIIPAWRDFLAECFSEGRPVRGIGEPIWEGRSPAELVECQRHEALLNLAFADSPAWSLLCPYDTEALEPPVIEEAERTHPYVVERGSRRGSSLYGGLEAIAAPLSTPLPEPPRRALELDLRDVSLEALRRSVAERAAHAGLPWSRATDLVAAVHELATNSLRHGGGEGAVLVWEEPGALVCEVRDRGRIEAPLIGRERPSSDQVGGWGVWMVNQLCDLVQIRAFPAGGAVRVHMRLPEAA